MAESDAHTGEGGEPAQCRGPLAPRVVVLVGPPGAGKTAVGSVLARVLGWPFVDTDAVVAERAGMSISDIFLTLGEAQFRAWEREAVSDAIGGGAPRVVAVGGGAPMDSHSADLLSEQFTVFLDVSEGVGVRRVGLSGARPLLAASPRARWRELMAERRPVYLWVARHVVHVDTLTPKATATQIARLLGNTAKGKGRGR